MIWKSHMHCKPVRDDVDGEHYLTVINYFIIRVSPPECRGFYESNYSRAPSYLKTFSSTLSGAVTRSLLTAWLCCVRNCSMYQIVQQSLTTALEVTTIKASSHFVYKYMLTPRFLDAQIAGKLIVDMSFLRDDGHIEISPSQSDCQGKLIGKPHYRVEYDIVPIVEGRNLRYEARWPAIDTRRPKKARLQRKVEIKGIAQISIAAAFQPGTG
jgi:hypothetical protein